MGQSLKAVRRQLRAWFAPVLPPAWIVMLYLALPIAFEAICLWIQTSEIYRTDSDMGELCVRMQGARDGVLALGVVLYGFYRVIAKHPWYRSEYADWLKLTPWRDGLPLPLGPVRLAPQDGLVLLATWLWLQNGPVLHVGELLALFLVPFVMAHLIPLAFSSGAVRVCTILMAFALVAWLRPASPFSMLILAACYAVVLSGLAHSIQSAIAGEHCAATKLAALLGSKDSAAGRRDIDLAFPYAQLSPAPRFSKISLQNAFLLSATLAVWLIAVVDYFPVQARDSTAYYFALIGLYLAILFRAVHYVGPYPPPISLLGRLMNGLWIIPGYDRVFIPSICAGIPVLVLLLIQYTAPSHLGWTSPLALFAGYSLALGMRPSYRQWALTGQHRISPRAKSRMEFIEI
jgi:hypothetical protein